MELKFILPLLLIFISSFICFILISTYFYLSINLKRISFLILYYFCVFISTFIVFSKLFKEFQLFSPIINTFIGFISMTLILITINKLFFKNKFKLIEKYLNTLDFIIPNLIYMITIYSLGFYY